jgi:hypothetical protein
MYFIRSCLLILTEMPNFPFGRQRAASMPSAGIVLESSDIFFAGLTVLVVESLPPMASGISDYARRSAVLLQTTERFEGSLGDPPRREAATKQLLSAADKDSIADVRLGFQVEAGKPPPASVSGRLSAVLFDLQSANVLVAAGLRAEKPKDQSGGELLQDARRQMATTREELLAPAVVPTGFAASLNLQSATLESATGQFQNYADQLLGEIVGESEQTIKTAMTELKKLDPAEIVKALGQIGKAVPIVAGAGQILRKGLEKLKRAIEALMGMFGKDAFKEVKEQIERIVKEAGVSGRTLLESLLGANSVKDRIKSILASPTLSIPKVDGASNSLPQLARDLNRDNKLLRAVLRAIQLAGLLLAQFAAPWVVPTLAIAYVLAIGATVLVGRQYTGAWRVLAWSDGVEQIADRIP